MYTSALVFLWGQHGDRLVCPIVSSRTSFFSLLYPSNVVMSYTLHKKQGDWLDSMESIAFEHLAATRPTPSMTKGITPPPSSPRDLVDTLPPVLDPNKNYYSVHGYRVANGVPVTGTRSYYSVHGYRVANGVAVPF